MNEETKSIWKKQLTGFREIAAWLGVFAAITLIAFFGLIQLDLTPTAIPTLVLAIGIGMVVVLTTLFILWVCCWRNFRKFLFGVACLITLIALVVAEENWRGKRAWENFKREWEAKGERFDAASVIPPPVPDEQNLAMSPIVASSYGWLLDQKGHEIRPRNTNIVNRLNWWIIHPFDGKGPTIGDWRKTTQTDLKVWQDYCRAPLDTNLHRWMWTNPIPAVAEPKLDAFPVTAEPQTPAADVLYALSKDDAAVEELREAARQRPYSRFPLGYDEFPPAVLLPHLSFLKRCSQELQLRTIAELEAGQSDKALADVKLSLRMTDSIRNEPFLISHLVRIAMMRITIQPIWEGMANHRWSDAQLAELQTELGKLDFLADYQFAVRGERWFSTATIEAVNRNRRLLREMREVCPPENLSWSTSSLLPSAFFIQNELAIARMFQEWTIPVVDLEHRTASPAFMRQIDKFVETECARFSPYTVFARLLFPAISSVAKKFVPTQTSVDLARVGCALERYHFAHGNYPDTLDALVPQFIAKLPRDIIGGQPLKYHRDPPSSGFGAASGQFILYSVGWNETDDGGVVSVWEKTGTVDLEKGDWVWRYPAK